jgi:hypothetical protein
MSDLLGEVLGGIGLPSPEGRRSGSAGSSRSPHERAACSALTGCNQNGMSIHCRALEHGLAAGEHQPRGRDGDPSGEERRNSPIQGRLPPFWSRTWLLPVLQADSRSGGAAPTVSTVGFPDSRVRDNRDRVRAAIRNVGLELPIDRIIVNLAAAHEGRPLPLGRWPGTSPRARHGSGARRSPGRHHGCAAEADDAPALGGGSGPVPQENRRRMTSRIAGSRLLIMTFLLMKTSAPLSEAM